MQCKSIRFLVISYFVVIAETGFCAYTATFDAQSYAKTVQILKEGKAQVETMRQTHSEITGMKKMIGNLKEELPEIRSNLLSWKTYYDKIDTLNGDKFSAMSWLGLNRYSLENNAPTAFDAVDNKLFRTHTTKEDSEDYTYVSNNIAYEREQIARKSLVTGIVVAEKNKNSIKESKSKVVAANKKSVEGADLLTLMKAQNEMLSVIAGELMQQRELQAQMLEFMTAHTANAYGTGKLVKPERSTKPSVFKK